MQVGVPAHRDRIRQLGRAVDEPVVEHVPRHLGMELHAPRALAEPVGLAGGIVLGEELGARRQLEAVVVPLERLEPGRHDAEHGIRPACRVGLDRAPADLGADVPVRRSPPAARAISWAPRQTPRSGTSWSIASRRKTASSASHGCSASWSGCMAPPNTMIAS